MQALIGNLFGTLMALRPSRRTRIVDTNLRLCFPDASAAQRRRWRRATYRASSRAALEHGVLWWASESRLRRLIRVENPELMLGDGVRPVIWLAPHFVGLDMGGGAGSRWINNWSRCTPRRKTR